MTPAAQHPPQAATLQTDHELPDERRMRRQRRWLLAFLLLAPPAIAELLSGSAPPLRFFHPVGFLILVLFYGGGTLLIRELRVRWGLGWAIALPAMAYGILEEGTAIQSFFNHNHVDLKVLAHYGVAGGVHWPWTLQLIFYHATVSTLIPIAIANLLWPAWRQQPLLRRRGWIAASVGLVVVTIFFWLVVAHQQHEMAQPYQMNALLVGGSAALVAALVALSYRLRATRLRPAGVPLLPPVLFGVVAFLVQATNLIMPNALAENGVAALTTVGVQAILFSAVLLFVGLQLCHAEVTPRHRFALVFGSLLVFVLLSPIQEFAPNTNPDPTTGMLAVGAVALISLVLLWRRVRRATTPSEVAPAAALSPVDSRACR